jgi:hypothetical protein
MGVLIPPGFGQANHMFQLVGGSDTYFVTIGYEEQGMFTTANDQALRIRVAWSATGDIFHPASYSSLWIYKGVRVTFVNSSGPHIGESLVADAGTAGANATLPVNTAFLVRKETSLGGRHGRGRMYLPPAFASEAQVTQAGILDSTLAATMQTKLTGALTGMGAENLRAVLLHSDPLVDPSPISALGLQLLVATQRRRLRK